MSSSSPRNSAELATIDVIVLRRPDGTMDFLPQHSASCRSCRLCGLDAQSEALAGDAPETPMRLSLPVRSLILAALGLYGLPLIGLLAGAITAAALGAGDAGALVGAMAGCVIAAFFMKRSAGPLEAATMARLRLHPAHPPEAER